MKKNIIIAAVVVMVIWIIVKVSVNEDAYSLMGGDYVENKDATALYEKIVKDGDFNFDHLKLDAMDVTQFEAFLLSFQKCEFKDATSFSYTDKCKPFELFAEVQTLVTNEKLAAMGRRLLHHPSEQVRLATFTIFVENDFYLEHPRDLFQAAENLKDGRIDFYLLYLSEHPDILLENKKLDELPWLKYSGFNDFIERCKLSHNPAVKRESTQYGKTAKELADSVEETDESYQTYNADIGCYTVKDEVVRGTLMARCPVSEDFKFNPDCRALKYFKWKNLRFCGFDTVENMDELTAMTKSEFPQTRLYGYVFLKGEKLLTALEAEKDATALGLYLYYYLSQDSFGKLEDYEKRALIQLTEHSDERISSLAKSIYSEMSKKQDQAPSEN